MDSNVCDTKHQSITFLWILRAMDGWPIRCGQANRDAGRKIPFIARRPWPSDLIEIFATDLERTKKWIIWTTAMRANQRAVGQDRELGEMKENGSNFKTELNHILRWTRDIKSGRTIKQRRETVAPKRPCPINLERILHKSFSWKYFFLEKGNWNVWCRGESCATTRRSNVKPFRAAHTLNFGRRFNLINTIVSSQRVDSD